MEKREGSKRKSLKSAHKLGSGYEVFSGVCLCKL